MCGRCVATFHTQLTLLTPSHHRYSPHARTAEYQAGPGGAVVYADDDVLPAPAQLPEPVRRRLSEGLRCDPARRCSLVELLEALEAPVPGVDGGDDAAALRQEVVALQRDLATARARCVALRCALQAAADWRRVCTSD